MDEGASQAEVARRLRVSRQSVSVWARLPQGRLTARAAGRKSSFGESDRRWLHNALLKGARVHGFLTEVWTLPQVAQVLAQKRGKRFSTVHVWRLLGKLGFSCQRPAGRARERDEEAIQAWKQTEWPRLKKSPEGAAHDRLPRREWSVRAPLPDLHLGSPRPNTGSAVYPQ
jgi:transposase